MGHRSNILLLVALAWLAAIPFTAADPLSMLLAMAAILAIALVGYLLGLRKQSSRAKSRAEVLEEALSRVTPQNRQAEIGTGHLPYQPGQESGEFVEELRARDQEA